MAIYDVTASHELNLVQFDAGDSDLIAFGSVLGKSSTQRIMTLGLFAPAYVSVEYNRTAESTITFTQSAQAEAARTASSTITFTQTADRELPLSDRSASSTISFTQSSAAPSVREFSASNALSLTQLAESSIITRTAGALIEFEQTNGLGEVLAMIASSTLALTQSSLSSCITRTAGDYLDLEQDNNRIKASNTAFELTAENTLSFSQTNNRFILYAAAIALSADHTLSFTQLAIFPTFLTASSTLSLTQSGGGNRGKGSAQTLTFTQSVVGNLVRAMTASNSVSFTQAFTYVQLNSSGTPVNRALGTCKLSEIYSPLVGGGGLIPTSQPILQKKNDVIFFYPQGAICNATASITLRTPEFGDRDRNQLTRINRESRGGSLIVYRDPLWPKERVLVVDFTLIKDSEVDGILEFLETTLGKTVGFRDWQGRVWFGTLLTPDAPITRRGTNRNDIALEIMVDDPEPSPYTCNALELSQSAQAEVV